MLKSFFVRALVVLVVLSGCGPDEKEPKPGQVAFSFASKDALGGKASIDITPAFVSYSIRKPNGSIITNKIEMFSFNGEFVTQPQLFLPGQYHIQEFLVLNQANQIIYASPREDSPLADLVEEPLPLQFFIPYNEEVVHVAPEVLEVRDHLPGDFGYASFGLKIVDLLDINITSFLAIDEDHPPIDFSMEIIAKDAPLGNVKWSKTVHLTDEGRIHFPAKYAHYTLRASKPGFIPYVRHFKKQDLINVLELPVEFIPESLEGFILHEWEDGNVKLYVPNEENRCRMYARVDLAEGYSMISHYVFVMAWDTEFDEVGPILEETRHSIDCAKLVNFFGPPHAEAQNYCERIDFSKVESRDDITVYWYHELLYYKPGSTWAHFFGVDHEWRGANTPQP